MYPYSTEPAFQAFALEPASETDKIIDATTRDVVTVIRQRLIYAIGRALDDSDLTVATELLSIAREIDLDRDRFEAALRAMLLENP